jgi:RyR domain
MNIEQISKFAYSVLSAYSESIGEKQKSDWKDLHSEKKQTFRRGVDAHMSNPDISEEQAHDLWIDEKLTQGWKWGMEKDEKKKEHPNMVPYNELPENQKAKSTIFKSIVNNLSLLIK